ncbi:MAG: PAS domain S-box protein [Actinomycetota bacterium]|nr:PAS domain S-box protein [Actinomycetota bacterium]
MDADEAPIRFLVGTTSTLISIIKGGEPIYFSTACSGATGYSQEELPNMDYPKLVHPDYHELLPGCAAAIARGEKIGPNEELRIIMREGEEKWLYITSTNATYEGEPATLVEATDISEKKEMEEALRESEKRYHMIFESVGETICFFDRNLKLIGVNP